MADIIPILAAVTLGAPDGEISVDDLDRINSYCSKPFKAKDLFAFPAVMATDQLTTYATHLLPSSLKNFGADAESGRPYLLDHNVAGGIYGYTYAGAYDPETRDARAAVYLPRDRYPLGEGNGKGTDNEITDIMTGMRREVSVGFGGPNCEFICDICHTTLWSEDCWHIPGMKDAKTGELVTAGVDNARLLELSGVFKGACPGAIIGKAKKMFASTQFSSRDWREWLDQFELADPTRSHFVITRPASEEPAGTNQKQEKHSMKHKLAALAAKLGWTQLAVSLLGAPEAADEDTLTKQLADGIKAQVDQGINGNPLLVLCESEGIKTPQEFGALVERAKLGDKYVLTVRDNARAQCVRRYEGDAEVISAQIDLLPLSQVEALAASWSAEADKLFGIGENGEAAKRASTSAEVQSTVALNAEATVDTEKRVTELMSMTKLGRAALELKAKKK